MEDTLQLKAYAKINLALDVVGKREDGYHEVRMIMQTVKLYDKLTFRLLEEDAIRLKTNVGFLPCDENNLIYKAVRCLKEQYHVKQGMEIDLYKCIPVAAGMAGGSTDCAAALIGAAKLFGLHLDKQTLMKIGVRLGADVPYCIMRGTALSEGIGEILTPLPSIPDCRILIAKPPVGVSTKFVYEHLDEQGIETHPDVDGMVQAIREGNLLGITNRMGNVLENVTIPEYPVIDQIKKCMIEQGALNAMMSGSGPTVFGIYEDREKAEKTKRIIQDRNLADQVYVVDAFHQDIHR